MKAEIKGSEIKISDCFHFKESIKAINGRRFEPESKAWYVPNNHETATLLRMLGAEFDESADMPNDTGRVISDEPAVAGMPIRATPYKHQIAAFNFALRVFGAAV